MDTFQKQGTHNQVSDMTINVHIKIDNLVVELLKEFIAQVTWRLKKMSQELDDLTAKVEANGTVIGSAITLLQQIKQLLDAAGTDPAKLKALSDALAAKDQELADAIVANTPAAPV